MGTVLANSSRMCLMECKYTKNTLLRLNKYGKPETKFEVNHKYIRVKKIHIYIIVSFLSFSLFLLLRGSHGQIHEYVKKVSFVENNNYNSYF